MKRRAVIRRGAAALTVGALAGCTGSDPEFSLEVANTNIVETDDGYVAAEIVVTNTSDVTQSGIVYVTAQLNGEKSVELREVTLEPHSTRIVVVPYDVKYANVQSFSPSATVRPVEDD